MDAIGRFVAHAVLGTYRLSGGDVMCPSRTGRFIADSWFSDEPLPRLRRRSSLSWRYGGSGLGLRRPHPVRQPVGGRVLRPTDRGLNAVARRSPDPATDGLTGLVGIECTARPSSNLNSEKEG
jgi:hypothetical protein